MGLFDIFKKNVKAESVRTVRIPIIRSKFDSAQTTSDNSRHWAMADALSPDAGASPAVRMILRNRGRYEVANNSYAKGMVLTLANDCIGTGPRLQMQLENDALNTEIERRFAEWVEEVDLAERLRCIRMGRVVDGESFAIMVKNPKMTCPVKLDISLVEPEQVCDPSGYGGAQSISKGSQIDGIIIDEYGNRVEYYILNQHPYAVTPSPSILYTKYPADSVIHWYRTDRAGQIRGIPEITPALPLFANLRRYSLAVLAAAETAADFAAVLYTDAPAGGEAADVDALDAVPLEKRMMTTLPHGWRLGQLESSQPTTTYGEYCKSVLNEIARCMNIPFAVALGNSSDSNYASGRLDVQGYMKQIAIDRQSIESRVLNRIFKRWLDEAILRSDYLPIAARSLSFFPHQWFWDGREHVDPAKEANAQQVKLQNNTTTLAEEYAKVGKDWETEIRQRAKEKALCDSLGLVAPAPAPTGAAPDNTDDSTDKNKDDKNAKSNKSSDE